MQQPKVSKEIQKQMNKEVLGCLVVFCVIALAMIGAWMIMLEEGMFYDESEFFTVLVLLIPLSFVFFWYYSACKKIGEKWKEKIREENEAEQKKVSQSTYTGKPQGSLREYRFEMHSTDSQSERAFCPYCGNKIEVKSTMYCEQCGKKM